MNIYKIQKAVEETILAWRNDESEYGEIAVDNGNIDKFIKEVNETLAISITNELEEENKKPKSVINFEVEYYTLREAYAKLELENKKLTNALVNLALQLKDVE